MKKDSFNKFFITLITACYLIFLIKSLMLPLTLGLIFSLAFRPAHLFLTSKKIPQAVSAFFLTILFGASVMYPISALLTSGAVAGLKQIKEIKNLSAVGSALDGTMSGTSMIKALNLQSVVLKIDNWSPLNKGQIYDLIDRAFDLTSESIMSYLHNLVVSIPQGLTASIMILMTIFYIFIKHDEMFSYLRKHSSFDEIKTESLINAISDLSASVVGATFVTGLVQTAFMLMALLITKSSAVATFVILTFICSFIPMIGTGLISFYLITTSFMRGDHFSGIVFIIFAIFIALIDNIVRPMVIKGRSNLNGFVSFVSAIAALEAIGFYGLFLGPLVAGLFLKMIEMKDDAKLI